ncbi:hypothetical protein B0T19DRAFT_151951 [Cercophora scortea]|uniref:Uncharacterized protein n=1 Tax=Cercophora scortea TaxID=314031 RepID=A0AAE0MDI1_9PEZI|nr:hypothetical protein B0T19DRAFT_151951 [Cercophora scortea]
MSGHRAFFLDFFSWKSKILGWGIRAQPKGTVAALHRNCFCLIASLPLFTFLRLLLRPNTFNFRPQRHLLSGALTPPSDHHTLTHLLAHYSLTYLVFICTFLYKAIGIARETLSIHGLIGLGGKQKVCGTLQFLASDRIYPPTPCRHDRELCMHACGSNSSSYCYCTAAARRSLLFWRGID